MDVDELTKQILREAKFRDIRANLAKLEDAHVRLVLSDKNRRKNDAASLQEECYTLIRSLKAQVDPA